MSFSFDQLLFIFKMWTILFSCSLIENFGLVSFSFFFFFSFIKMRYPLISFGKTEKEGTKYLSKQWRKTTDLIRCNKMKKCCHQCLLKWDLMMTVIKQAYLVTQCLITLCRFLFLVQLLANSWNVFCQSLNDPIFPDTEQTEDNFHTQKLAAGFLTSNLIKVTPGR